MDCVTQFLYFYIITPEIYVNYHKHNCFELVYYEKGNGVSTINGSSFYYKNNTYSIIEPNSSHDERHFEDTSCLYIGFSYDNNPITLKNGIFHDDSDYSILRYLREMKDEMINKLPYYNLNLSLINQKIIIKHNRIHNNSAEQDKQKENKFEYIINYINNNYNQKIDLIKLADLSGYSYHHFRHLFKQNIGLSPLSYIINLRIEKAKQLLIEDECTISDIAYNCGFSNNSEFVVIFKKIVKMPPSEYRKRNNLPD